MKTKHTSQQAFAVIEYVVMIIVIIAALLAFRGYIQRAYQGQIARTGESMAFGRQYDPGDTIACVYDDKEHIWYAQACYDHNYGLGNCQISVNLVVCSNTVMHGCTSGCQITNTN